MKRVLKKEFESINIWFCLKKQTTKRKSGWEGYIKYSNVAVLNWMVLGQDKDHWIAIAKQVFLI